MISSTEWKTISAKHGKRSISKQARVGEKGFSLFVTMLALSSMIGMLGLSFDLGHMFIVRTELQTRARNRPAA